MSRTQTTPDNNRFRKLMAPGGNGRSGQASRAPLNGADTGAYSLMDSERHGYQLCLSFPWLLVGLGTTGTAIIHQAIHFIVDAVGSIPSGCRYLTIDAAPIHAGPHQLHHIAIGTDGAGTNPHNGLRLFLEYYPLIRHALQCQIDQLCSGVAAQTSPLKTAREVSGFLVVAGSGGTSGGILDPTISLLHDCAQRRSIADPRVEVVLLGPGMPLRDSSRQPLPEQTTLIHNTYAENSRRIYGLMASPGRVRETRPDGTAFSAQAKQRVAALQKVDYTNGFFDFATTGELVDMLGHGVFVHLFTDAGKQVRERGCDHDGIGATGRPVN